MDKKLLERIHAEIRAEMAQSFDFWLKNGIDPDNGGIYTCLDREGKVYSTDKSVWMQGRTAWLFSHLCNVYGEKPAWRNAARSCLQFLDEHCFNKSVPGRMYFTVTRDGQPLRQRRYFFSECFYAIACAEYYALAGDEKYLNAGLAAYELVWELLNGLIADPINHPPKVELPERRGRSIGAPMIYMNMSSVFSRCDPSREAVYTARALECAEIILNYHMKDEIRATLEVVGMEGEFWKDVSAGRLVNPGHDVECAWFIMELARKTGDGRLRNKALDMMEYAWEAGYDNEYGGLLYFVDALGKPPEAYEHDMKLWWPHNEMLISSLMAFGDTGNEIYLNRFLEIYDYTRQVFYDPEYGDWFGYLRRDGKPTMPAVKGSTYKGPFHLGRMYIMLDKMLEEMLI